MRRYQERFLLMAALEAPSQTLKDAALAAIKADGSAETADPEYGASCRIEIDDEEDRLRVDLQTVSHKVRITMRWSEPYGDDEMIITILEDGRGKHFFADLRAFADWLTHDLPCYVVWLPTD